MKGSFHRPQQEEQKTRRLSKSSQMMAQGREHPTIGKAASPPAPSNSLPGTSSLPSSLLLRNTAVPSSSPTSAYPPLNTSVNSHSTLKASLPPETAACISSVFFLSRMNVFTLALALIPSKHEQILPPALYASPPSNICLLHPQDQLTVLFHILTLLLSYLISRAYTSKYPKQ